MSFGQSWRRSITRCARLMPTKPSRAGKSVAAAAGRAVAALARQRRERGPKTRLSVVFGGSVSPRPQAFGPDVDDILGRLWRPHHRDALLKRSMMLVWFCLIRSIAWSTKLTSDGCAPTQVLPRAFGWRELGLTPSGSGDGHPSICILRELDLGFVVREARPSRVAALTA